MRCGQHRRTAAAVGIADTPTGTDQLVRSDGRNYMAHVTTFFLAIDPRHNNEAVYQKTIGINDWYTAGPTDPSIRWATFRVWAN